MQPQNIYKTIYNRPPIAVEYSVHGFKRLIFLMHASTVIISISNNKKSFLIKKKSIEFFDEFIKIIKLCITYVRDYYIIEKF